MSRRMKMIFTISVLFNILLLGVAGGIAYQHCKDPYMETMQEAMSPEGRNIVARTMQQAFREGRDDMESARDAKKEIRAIISAEEFDEVAFDDAAKNLGGIMRGMGEKRIAVTKELAMQLSQEDRVVLAIKFSKGFHGGHYKIKREKYGPPLHFLKEQSDGERVKGVRPMEAPELPGDMPPPPAPAQQP